MNPIVHGELAWLLLTPPLSQRRDRTLVTWAGVAPDLDGLTLVLYPWDHGEAYGHYHHLLTHSLPAALVMGGVAAALATPAQRGRTALLAFAAFHLHLLCDLMGSGAEWPMYYLWPFHDLLVMPFKWGWELSSWQNMVIAFLCMGAIFRQAVVHGRSIVEALSAGWDEIFCGVLRKWWRRSPPPA
jgi:hypothetical protein